MHLTALLHNILIEPIIQNVRYYIVKIKKKKDLTFSQDKRLVRKKTISLIKKSIKMSFYL